MSDILREKYMAAIQSALAGHPICALLGPRQCGKTTLAHHYIAAHPQTQMHFFDLEDPDDQRVFANPKLILDHLKGLVIIDEVQRCPELFPYLRVLVDRNKDIQLLLLGSASRDLLQQSSESLAGRISYVEITPFMLAEVGFKRDLWVRGGFPRSFLAVDEPTSFQWRRSYVRTYLEQDIPNFGFSLNPQVLRRFWTMLCDFHGQIFNASELGRSLNMDHKTAKRYLDILASTFMVRQLQPWYENISKRQVKSCKVYFRDSGIFHTLLNFGTERDVMASSKLGASWEGYALEQVIQALRAEPEECFFWAAQVGGEVDLLVARGQEKQAFEFKFSSKPILTKSMHLALSLLKLEKLTVIVPGTGHSFLDERVEVVGLERYVGGIKHSPDT